LPAISGEIVHNEQMRRLLPLLPALVTMACGSRATLPATDEINVATAANLTRVFAELGQIFERETGIHLVTSFGATTQLAQQIEHGAPYDVFAAADTEHVDELARKGLIFEDTRAIYARGKLVLWVPGSRTAVMRLEDLARADVTHIAIANPQLAPYGRAAVETLHALHLWEVVQPRIVFAQNVSMATRYAATGNADVAFTALALVYDKAGRKIEVAANLHAPIDQAIAVLRSSAKPEQARKFVAFIVGKKALEVFKRYGYD